MIFQTFFKYADTPRQELPGSDFYYEIMIFNTSFLVIKVWTKSTKTVHFSLRRFSHVRNCTKKMFFQIFFEYPDATHQLLPGNDFYYKIMIFNTSYLIVKVRLKSTKIVCFFTYPTFAGHKLSIQIWIFKKTFILKANLSESVPELCLEWKLNSQLCTMGRQIIQKKNSKINTKNTPKILHWLSRMNNYLRKKKFRNFFLPFFKSTDSIQNLFWTSKIGFLTL